MKEFTNHSRNAVVIIVAMALVLVGAAWGITSTSNATTKRPTPTPISIAKSLDPPLAKWMAGGNSNTPGTAAALAASTFYAPARKNNPVLLVLVRQGACAEVSLNSNGKIVVTRTSNVWKNLFAPASDCSSVAVSLVKVPGAPRQIDVGLRENGVEVYCLEGGGYHLDSTTGVVIPPEWGVSVVDPPQSCAGVAELSL